MRGVTQPENVWPLAIRLWPVAQSDKCGPLTHRCGPLPSVARCLLECGPLTGDHTYLTHISKSDNTRSILAKVKVEVVGELKVMALKKDHKTVYENWPPRFAKVTMPRQ